MTENPIPAAQHTSLTAKATIHSALLEVVPLGSSHRVRSTTHLPKFAQLTEARASGILSRATRDGGAMSGSSVGVAVKRVFGALSS